MPRTVKTLETMFADRVTPEPNSGCWLWTGAPEKDGYGRFKLRGRMLRAHRLSYEMHRGPVPENALVLHRCDVPACVNPAHLFLGTHQENIADRDAKGRQARGDRNASRAQPENLLRGSAHPRAKLDERIVLAMRKLRARGITLGVLADAFDVSVSEAHIVCAAGTWRHV